jgi:hypothetical protein
VVVIRSAKRAPYFGVVLDLETTNGLVHMMPHVPDLFGTETAMLLSHSPLVLTMFREPISRVVSSLFYCRQYSSGIIEISQ